jgi:putative ABC transport system substrate-binding protein
MLARTPWLGQRMKFNQLKRREFITLLGSAAAVRPGTVLSQTPPRRLIGVLLPGSKALSFRYFNGFAQGMRELGYVEGRDYLIEVRYAEGDLERLPTLANEIVRLNAAVIVTGGNAAAVSAKEATARIPIVGLNITDPVGLGLAASDARPGSNVTGTRYRVEGMTAKQLEMARDLVPGAMKVGVLVSADAAQMLVERRELEAAATQLGLELMLGEALARNEIGRVFQSLAQESARIVVVLPHSRLVAWRRQIAAFALATRLPTVFGFREFVEDGGLISYGIDLRASYRRAAYFVDRILKGGNPADLPFEFPNQLELVINLTTAKAIGLTIPPTLLARADEVIE